MYYLCSYILGIPCFVSFVDICGTNSYLVDKYVISTFIAIASHNKSGKYLGHSQREPLLPVY